MDQVLFYAFHKEAMLLTHVVTEATHITWYNIYL